MIMEETPFNLKGEILSIKEFKEIYYISEHFGIVQ